ncbi:MAG: hypothetical protein LCI00_11095 [Chloroflexi bacterium]|nr:hypothetical protein [Chloroflexota bacterium]
MKSGSMGKDILHVAGIGIGLTLLLVIIGVAASIAIGIPGSATPDGTPATVNLAAIIPTSPPPTATPTEIPCTADTWWGTNGTAAGEVFTKARTTTINTRVPDVQTAQAALKVWQTNFEVTDVAPPCAKAAKDAVLAAAKTASDLYNFYTTPTTEQQRAEQSIQLENRLLVVYDALEDLEIEVTDPWLIEVRDFSRSECTAARWYTEDFIGKGYNNFIKTNPKIDITILSAAQMTDLLRQFRTLESSLNTDKPRFPACILPAVDYLITYFKAGGDALNAALNNELASVQGSLTLMPTALNSFFATIKTLDPNLGA